LNTRKVLEMGGGTLLVSLPKSWAKKNGIRKGATVAVEELAGRKLMVRPIEGGEEEQRQTVVDYPGDDLSQVINEVTGAYLLGYDIIRVEGKKVITREDRSKLKATMGRLVGLEIMDEDSKKMSVQFLLEPAAIVPEKIVRRMSGLLDGMLRDTVEALEKGDPKLLALVGERDDEVDRLYFLLVRATRAAISRPEVAERYGLSQVDLLDYRVLASFLESIGDAVTELSRKLRGGAKSKRLAHEYASCVARLNRMNDLATRAFISRRAGKPRSINMEVNALAGEVSTQLVRIARLPAGEGAADVLGSLERVSRMLVDVSDLAVITQQVQ
jgi:phosphate uptake regulator